MLYIYMYVTYMCMYVYFRVAYVYILCVYYIDSQIMCYIHISLLIWEITYSYYNRWRFNSLITFYRAFSFSHLLKRIETLFLLSFLLNICHFKLYTYPVVPCSISYKQYLESPLYKVRVLAFLSFTVIFSPTD